MKNFLSIVAAFMLSLSVMAQSNFYVVLKDGSALRFSADDVDSLSFDAPDGGKVMGLGELIKMFDEMTYELDSLEDVVSNPYGTGWTQSVGGHKYVDLGLPSGTLWATTNIGATRPEEPGDRFAWGETETKESYTEKNCKWSNKGNSVLQSDGVIDNVKDTTSISSVGRLTAAYDAATVNRGGKWRMPTKDEVKELFSNCTQITLTKNGIIGKEFTGPNGKTLFLPITNNNY